MDVTGQVQVASQPAHPSRPARPRSRGSVSGAVLIALLVLAAGCAPATPADAVFTIRVGIYPTIDMLPIYVMEHEGIAARYGFTPAESPYGSGLAVAQAIAKDEIDVAYPGLVPLFSLSAAGQVPSKVAVVGIATVASPEFPVGQVLAGSAIASWHDLQGRQVATHNTTSANAAAFSARARAEGVTAFEFVVVAFPDMGLAVRDGVVAAAAMDEPYATQSVLRGDGHVLAYVFGEPPITSAPVVAIAARAAMLGGRQLTAFLRAHLDAVRFIRDHPDEARQLLVAKLGVSETVAARMNLRDFPLDARIDMASVTALEEVLLAAGAIPARLDLASFSSSSPLDSIPGAGG